MKKERIADLAVCNGGGLGHLMVVILTVQILQDALVFKASFIYTQERVDFYESGRKNVL